MQLVTDHYVYYEWVLENVESSGFEVKTRTIKAQFDTKFERKWQEEGQEEFFEIVFTKHQHLEYTFPDEVELKTYTVDNFDPQKFNFSDVKGDPTIVLKDFFFDEKRQAAMLHLIVNEAELVQHFRVTVLKKGSAWRICKTDGQQFLPTPGINTALKCVYETIKNG